MPYGVRREVAVKMLLIPGLLYAFRTDVDQSTSTVLGHVPALVGSGYSPGVVFGINSPKPPRGKKMFTTGSKHFEESFVDHAKIDSARTAGWEIRPGKILALRNTKFSKVVSVDYKIIDPVDAAEGIEASGAKVMKYAWRMPQYQYAKLLATDKTALGIEDFDATKRGEYIVGANSARPTRAVKFITAGNVTSRVTTFAAWNKADDLDGSDASKGWSTLA